MFLIVQNQKTITSSSVEKNLNQGFANLSYFKKL
jgi:hypothetical protein